MTKITILEIAHFLELYQKHQSLRKVSFHSNRSINTIKKYLIKKVPLNLKNIISSTDESNTSLIGTYIGLWMGDGTQYYDKGYVIKICSDKRQTEFNEFVQSLILRLFNKTSCLIEEKNTNQAYIKFHSKYIYDYVFKYVEFKPKKSLNIKLKEDIENLPLEFLKGVLLGLTLSDGYLKQNFRFNVISESLADNMCSILKKLNFNPLKYTYNRPNPNWNPLYMIRLNRKESIQLISLFDNLLLDLNIKTPFMRLKNGPAEI